MKKAVMVEAELRQPNCPVTSTVHRRNSRMNKINENLRAVTERNPDDREYLLTVVEARLTD